jgi:hypothetical protein
MVRTNFFDFVRQSRYWKVASGIESFKFTLYLGIPVAASVFYADADFMHGLVRRLDWVRYPKEDPKPPLGEDIDKHRLSKMVHDVKRKAAERRKQ